MARKRKDGKSSVAGAVLTVSVHVCLLVLFSVSGMKYIFPPPPEEGILIEFEDDGIKPVVAEAGVEPRQPEPESEDVRLVQKAESAETGDKADAGVETTMGEDGDVEKPEPPRKKEIDRRALFPTANNNRDTVSSQKSRQIEQSLTAGHPDGNAVKSVTTGEPEANLAGRTPLNGKLPKPEYSIEKSGTVVVKIYVDQYGKVTGARAGAEGTTVVDKELWKAAEQAALKARFSVSDKAPAVQEGTITYIFRLR